MSKNKQNEVTPAGAVELEESKLDQAAGGAVDYFLKITDAAAPEPGEVSLKMKIVDL